MIIRLFSGACQCLKLVSYELPCYAFKCNSVTFRRSARAQNVGVLGGTVAIQLGRAYDPWRDRPDSEIRGDFTQLNVRANAFESVLVGSPRGFVERPLLTGFYSARYGSAIRVEGSGAYSFRSLPARDLGLGTW